MSHSRRHNSSGESHLGDHRGNSSKLSSKSLGDSRAIKWSVSSNHHSLSGHDRDSSNARENFAVYRGSQADCQLTRPISDQYRGHNAYTPEDSDICLHRTRDFDKGLDDMNNVVRMRSSSLKLRESSPNHNKRYWSPSSALNSVPPYYHCGTSQKGQYSYRRENLQTSRNQTQLRQDQNQYAERNRENKRYEKSCTRQYGQCTN